MKMWTPAQPPPTNERSSKRLAKAAKPPRKRWLTIAKWLTIAAVSGAILLVATVAFVFWMYGRDPSLPDFNALSDYRPKQVIAILDANDRRIGELYGPDSVKQRRTVVPYDKIPPIVVDAFVAAEDNRFWTHGGVDYWGMFRAFLANLRSGKTSQGASTITQQVVKTFLLTPEKTFKRKIQEIILARRLEKSLTKQEIVMLYVNQIYFANNRYGIQEAARFYFGKDVGQLSVGDAAILAGIVQRPEDISPLKNPKRAKERQIYVLNQLVEMNKITQAEAQKWIDAPIQVVKDPFPELGAAPEWTDMVRRELVANLAKEGKDESALDSQGGTVRTTLDPALQHNAHRALQAGLRAVDKRKKTGRAVRTVKSESMDKELAKLTRALGKGPVAKEVYDAIVTKVSDTPAELAVDLGNYPATLALGDDADARFNPPDEAGNIKKPSERFKIGDVVQVIAAGSAKGQGKQHRVAFAPGPEGAVVVIEVKTRKVRAIVGGYSSKLAGFNRATMAKRQPGSSFKPFVFASAIEAKKITAGSRINDAPEVFELWRPKNYDSKFAGPVLLRDALAKSINTISIKVTYDITPDVVADLATKMGISSKLPHEMSLALGSGEVTPLEMTNAIATFAAGGRAAPPKFIEAIDGKATAVDAGAQVLSPQTAYIVTDMMRSVVTSGTGHLASKLGVPIAGKTGTSNDARDTWFIGMTPDYVIGVWLGYDDNRSMGKETGGTTAVPVFVDVAKKMSLPAKSFQKPTGIAEARIDRASGDLAPEGAPKDTTMTELYLEGTVPTTVAAKPGDVTEQNLSTSEYED